MNTAPLWQWVRERHAIYQRRARGDAPPWTADPILREYRFTNVYRELDRTTVWIREHIREPYADHPQLWFMLAAARLINYTPTLEQVLPVIVEWKPSLLLAFLRERQRAGLKMFTSAYMLTTHSAAMPKAEYYVRKILEPLYHSGQRSRPTTPVTTSFGEYLTVQLWCEWLEYHNGLGEFLSYQICVDMMHTRYLRSAPDRETWARAGVGTRRGLERLLGIRNRPTGGSSMSQERALSHLVALTRESHTAVPELPQISLSDMCNCVCEVDKYLRTASGDGKPRARYQPHEE